MGFSSWRGLDPGDRVGCQIEAGARGFALALVEAVRVGGAGLEARLVEDRDRRRLEVGALDFDPPRLAAQVRQPKLRPAAGLEGQDLQIARGRDLGDQTLCPEAA